MTRLDDNKLPLLAAKVFSRSTLVDLANKKLNPILLTLFNQTSLGWLQTRPLSETFHVLYDILISDYPNEYTYKNTIALKIIKGRHKFSNVSYVNELRAGKSLCDIAIFNGTSTAYEIKTKLDNLDRLPTQLLDYQSIFEKVYVVADNSKISALEQLTQKNIGICEISKRGTISTIREAKSNIKLLSREKVFYSLKPSEALEIVVNHFDYEPHPKASFCRNDCLNLFKLLDLELVNFYFVKAMKSRQLLPYEKEAFNKLPNALLALLLNLRLTRSKLSYIDSIMNAPYLY